MAVQFEYDGMGRRSRLRLGAGQGSDSIVDYAYEGSGRLHGLARDMAGSGGDQSIGFGYNPASQIVSWTNTNDAYASNTAYDVQRPYSANRLNQYTAAGQASFTYDANGNLSSDGGTTYVYDAENRLVSATGAHNATLTYDPLGRLHTVTGASGTRRYVYDGDDLLEEYDGAGSRLRVYAHGPGGDEPLILYELTGGPLRRYLHADHQGSIVAMADTGAPHLPGPARAVVAAGEVEAEIAGRAVAGAGDGERPTSTAAPLRVSQEGKAIPLAETEQAETPGGGGRGGEEERGRAGRGERLLRSLVAISSAPLAMAPSGAGRRQRGR